MYRHEAYYPPFLFARILSFGAIIAPHTRSKVNNVAREEQSRAHCFSFARVVRAIMGHFSMKNGGLETHTRSYQRLFTLNSIEIRACKRWIERVVCFLAI